MAEIDQVHIKVGIDGKDVNKDLATLENKLVTGFSRIASQAVAPLAAIFSLGALGMMFNDIVNEADKVGEAAESIGVAVDELHAWQEAARLAGGSAEGLNGSVDQLGKSLTAIAVKGTSKVKPFLDELGVSALDAGGKARNTFTVLGEIAAQVEGMDKQESRGLLQSMGFDSGTIMLLQKGGKAVQEAIKYQKELGVYTLEDAEAAAKYNDELDILTRTMKMSLLPAVVVAVSVLAEAANGFRQGLLFSREHIEVFLPVLAGLAAMLTGKLALALDATAAKFVKMAVSFLLSPWGVALAALLAIGLAIEDLLVWLDGGESLFASFWEKVFGPVDKARAFFDGMKEDFYSLLDAMQPVFDAALFLLSAWGAAFMVVAKIIATIFLTALTLIIKAIAFLLSLFAGLASGAGEAVDKMIAKWQTFKDTIAGYIDAVKDKLSGLWEFGGKVMDGIGKVFSFAKGGEKTAPELAAQSKGGAVGDFRQVENNLTQEVNINMNGGDPQAVGKAVGNAFVGAGKDITGAVNSGM